MHKLVLLDKLAIIMVVYKKGEYGGGHVDFKTILLRILFNLMQYLCQWELKHFLPQPSKLNMWG